MPKRIELKPGDVVGPHGVKFLSDLPDYVKPSGKKARMVLARCPSCGGSWGVMLESVRSQNTSCCASCGKKKLTEMNRSNTTHGLTVVGFEATDEEKAVLGIWSGIVQRCLNPNDRRYPSYGGRGIQLYRYWQGPMGLRRFVRAMGPRPSPYHSIDRINPNGPYDPFNCQWKSTREQCNNKRNTRRIMWKGRERSLADIADEAKMNYGTLRGRLNRGMSIEEVVTVPVNVDRYPRPEATLTHEGKTLTLTEWSERTGIPRLVLTQRKSKGWPVDLILTTPAYSKFFGWEQNVEHERQVEAELSA